MQSRLEAINAPHPLNAYQRDFGRRQAGYGLAGHRAQHTVQIVFVIQANPRRSGAIHGVFRLLDITLFGSLPGHLEVGLIKAK